MSDNPIEDADFWRGEINSFYLDLPSKGLKPPEMENIQDPNVLPFDTEGIVNEIQVNIYFFSSPQIGKYLMISKDHRMIDHGNMTLGDAFKLITRRKRRRRG